MPPSFARLVERGFLTSLTTVLPSTTTAALVSFSTGVTPQEHGMLGYRLFLRELGIVANMIGFCPHTGHHEFPNAQLNAEQFVPQPTVYQRLRKRSAVSSAIVPKAYHKS